MVRPPRRLAFVARAARRATPSRLLPATRNASLRFRTFQRARGVAARLTRRPPRRQSWLWEKSATWRRVVASTRASRLNMVVFTTACFVLPAALGAVVMGVRLRARAAACSRGSGADARGGRSKPTQRRRRHGCGCCASARVWTARCSPRCASLTKAWLGLARADVAGVRVLGAGQ